MGNKKTLTRDVDNQMLTGVLAGIAKKYNLNLEILRIVYALITFFFAIGPGVIIYIIMALIMPKDTDDDILNNDKNDVL